MATPSEILEEIKERFAEFKQSMEYGIAEDNIDPDLGEELLADLKALTELVMDNI